MDENKHIRLTSTDEDPSSRIRSFAKFSWCFHKIIAIMIFTMQSYKKLNKKNLLMQVVDFKVVV